MPALPRDLRGDLRALAGAGRSALARGGAGPVLSLADQALVSACNFATTIVLAHALGLEAFGLFSTAWIAVLLTVSLQLGLVVCPMASIGPGLRGEAGHAYYGIVLVHEAGFVALAAAAVGTGLALTFGDPTLGLSTGAACAAHLAQDFTRRYLFARGRPRAVLGIDALNQGVKLAALVTLSRMQALGPATALQVIAASAALSWLSAIPFRGALAWRPGLFREVTGRQWHSGRWLVLTGLMQWLIGYGGLLVAGALLGVTLIGVLRAAQSILGMLNLVRDALENTVPPIAGRALAERGLDGLLPVIVVTATIGFAGGLSTTGLLALSGKSLLALAFGPDIVAYAWVVAWYSLLFPVSLVSFAQICAFRAIERTGAVFAATASAACLNLALIYPAVRWFGIEGLLGVAITTEVMVCLVLAGLLRRELKARLTDAPRGRGLQPA
ncbi:lipopolysaccharide biosynthesis protein [Methylorubrum zatmanii]